MGQHALGLTPAASGRGQNDGVAILLWLLPAVLATVAAMCWVAWVGRERPAGPDRSEAALTRFGEALGRPMPEPTAVRHRPERSTGVAIRRDRSA